jgi:hypothetical protein
MLTMAAPSGVSGIPAAVTGGGGAADLRRASSRIRFGANFGLMPIKQGRCRSRRSARSMDSGRPGARASAGAWQSGEARAQCSAEKVVVAAPGITFQRLDGRQAAAHGDELQAVHREVYGQADHEAFAGQFRIWRRRRGFVLAEARRGDYLVGFAAGIPLRPSTSRRKDLTAPLPAEITTEHPDRTFALTVVRWIKAGQR